MQERGTLKAACDVQNVLSLATKKQMDYGAALCGDTTISLLTQVVETRSLPLLGIV